MRSYALPALALLLLSAAGIYFWQSASTDDEGYTPPPAFTSSYADGFDLLQQTNPLPSDSLSESEMLRRIGKLYRHQADLMEAHATGNESQVTEILSHAVRDMRRLMRHPGVTEEGRFERIYQHLIAEYEEHFGVPDTLNIARGGIFEIRADMFAAMDKPDAPLMEEAMAEDLLPESADVPMPLNEAVRSGLQYMQGGRHGNLDRWMKRKDTYFPMIEHIFAEEGVPDELKYLAIVESGLNPKAVSHMGAAGLWQFMPATGQAYGLRITPWVDERFDPEKSTRAAARHLRDLYELFGNDWHLALAGYNFSPPRLRNVLRDHGPGASYWDVRDNIPQETRNYVPSFIATSLAMSNPGEFNIGPTPSGPRYRYDNVPVQGMLDIELVAELADTSPETIRALNPELRGNTLPPSAQPYDLRLPYGSYSTFARAYQDLPDEEKNLTLTHEVKSGETVGGISSRYRISASTLREVNDFEGTNIRAGEELVIPLSGDTETGIEAVTGIAGDPVSISYGTRSIRGISPDGEPLPGHQPSAAGGHLAIHIVEYGDTLFGLAQRYGVTVRELRRWNNLSSNTLSLGQEIKIQG